MVRTLVSYRTHPQCSIRNAIRFECNLEKAAARVGVSLSGIRFDFFGRCRPPYDTMRCGGMGLHGGFRFEKILNEPPVPLPASGTGRHLGRSGPPLRTSTVLYVRGVTAAQLTSCRNNVDGWFDLPHHFSAGKGSVSCSAVIFEGGSAPHDLLFALEVGSGTYRAT